MVALTARPKPAPPQLTVLPPVTRQRRPIGMYVVIGIPILLALTFIWQVGSSMLHTDAIVRHAVAVGQVTLEADPLGSRIDFVLVDRVGQETAFSGKVTVRLREPDGAVWQMTRTVSDADFQSIQAGSLLSGRLGYSVVVPASDWARAPRRGGSATVSIEVNPSDDGPAFSTVSEQRFP